MNQQLPYTSLNSHQLAQVAYLFADEHFGTDANAYLYEVNKDGDVKSRVPQKTKGNTQRRRAKPNSPVKVHIIKEAHLTNEIIHNARMHLEAFAQSAAEHISQLETQEVNHEQNK